MQTNAISGATRSAYQGSEGAMLPAQAQDKNVSRSAQRAMFCGSVTMESEAFGVLVTRRPEAITSKLTPYEEARLLDVLCHAKHHLNECQEQETEFPTWVVSSDARDTQPRVTWLAMRKEATGAYRIRLSEG
jgi:hypothetical protein